MHSMPAVLVVYFRTLLNGWTTNRRMRTANNIAKHNLPHCPLCGIAQDSLEHTAYCYWTDIIFKRFDVPITCTTEFLCLDHACTVVGVLTQRVRALAVVYLVYNTVTHHSSSSPPLSIPELLNVACARPGAPRRVH